MAPIAVLERLVLLLWRMRRKRMVSHSMRKSIIVSVCPRPWLLHRTFDPKYDDFFITRIGDTTQTDKEFWRLFLNFKDTKGGCQQEVKSTDKILWAFNGFNKKYFLSLSGPETAQVNQPITVTVIDGVSNVPIQGASVGGRLTDADGHATLTFNTVGVHVLKAEREDSIRSNALKVTVTN